VIFRHLDYPADTEPEQLGLAALDDLLDRGDFLDWAPLAQAVAADPHGPLAQRILGLVDAHPMYGTSLLWRGWIQRLRDRRPVHPAADQAAPVATPAALPDAALTTCRTPLRGLRERAGLTQQQVAEVMGVAQPDLSRLERRADAKLSTLQAYAQATGARLRLIAEVGAHRIEVRLGPDGRSP